MSILIDKVRIKNFRSLRNVEVNLSPVTLLVGANNAGKTTFLRALNTVLGVSKTQINRDDLFIDLNGKQPAQSIVIDVRVIPVNDQGKRSKEFNSQWGSIFGSDVQIDESGDFFAFRTEIKFSPEGDKYESFQYFLTDWKNPNPKESEKLTSPVFRAILLYFIDAQRDLNEDVKLRTSYFGKLATQLNNDYDEEGLREITDAVSELNNTAISKSKVLTHLQNKLSELNRTTYTTGKGVSISPFPKKIRDLHKGMKVDFQDNGSDSFSLEYHGMGTRSWASILSFSAFTSWETQVKTENGEAYFPILALEEPEAHLHPNAQRTLYRQLKNVGGQKIISTHSPYIAGQAELEELRHFYKAKDQVEITQIDLGALQLDEKQKGKAAIEATRGEVLFSNVVVMCEGETEEIILPIFAKHYFKQLDFELGINFVKTGKYYPLLYLFRFLKTEWFIFSDYDKPDVKTALNNVLKKNEISTLSNVVKLNDENTQMDIEEYLFVSGYEAELKTALKQFKEPIYVNEQHQATKKPKVEAENLRIDGLSKNNFLEELKDWKTKVAPIYAELILKKTEEQERIPPKIKELFDKVSVRLAISMANQ